MLKGQLISKGLFGILNSSKKRTKKFDLTTMIPQVDLFSFVFWKNLKSPKRHFEIMYENVLFERKQSFDPLKSNNHNFWTIFVFATSPCHF